MATIEFITKEDLKQFRADIARPERGIKKTQASRPDLGTFISVLYV